MGHVTISASNMTEVRQIAAKVKETIRVVSK